MYSFAVFCDNIKLYYNIHPNSIDIGDVDFVGYITILFCYKFF